MDGKSICPLRARICFAARGSGHFSSEVARLRRQVLTEDPHISSKSARSARSSVLGGVLPLDSYTVVSCVRSKEESRQLAFDLIASGAVLVCGSAVMCSSFSIAITPPVRSSRF